MKMLKVFLPILIPVLFLASFKPRDMVWVAIGDSITYLNDHLDETGNRATSGYLTDVTKAYPHIQYINKGYNGWTAGNIAAHIDSLGIAKADVYSVFLGTNDWWQGRPMGTPDDYKANTGNGTVYGSFRLIINKLRSLNPQAKILLITPMQRADFVYINDGKNNAYGSYKLKNSISLEDYTKALQIIGSYEHIAVCDLYHNPLLPVKNMVKFKRLKDPQTGRYVNYKYPRSATVPFNPITDEYPYPKEAINLTYDGLHPSDKGNRIIAKAVIVKFRQMLEL